MLKSQSQTLAQQLREIQRRIEELEKKVKDVIARDLPVAVAGHDIIRIGEEKIYCTGTRTHVKSTGQIENFRLLKDYKHDPIHREYLLVGMVGHREVAGFEDMIEVYG